MNKKKWMEKHLGRPGRRALKRMERAPENGPEDPEGARRLARMAKARQREYRAVLAAVGYKRISKAGRVDQRWDPDGPENNEYWRPMLALRDAERVVKTIRHGHRTLETVRATLLREPPMSAAQAARALGRTENQVRRETDLFLRVLEARYLLLAGKAEKPKERTEPKPHHRGPWDRK